MYLIITWFAYKHQSPFLSDRFNYVLWEISVDRFISRSYHCNKWTALYAKHLFSRRTSVDFSFQIALIGDRIYLRSGGAWLSCWKELHTHRCRSNRYVNRCVDTCRVCVRVGFNYALRQTLIMQSSKGLGIIVIYTVSQIHIIGNVFFVVTRYQRKT